MSIPHYHPEVQVVALQLMPDHLHGILAPWEHHNERRTIRRDQCLTLNDMTAMICGAGGDGRLLGGAEQCSAVADYRNTPSTNDQCGTSANGQCITSANGQNT